MKNILSKIKFRGPQKSDVVIFDSTGSEFINKLILNGIDYAVLPVRHEEFYFTPKLAELFLKNFFCKFILRRDCRNIGFIYMLSCIECMQPKIVVTFIDNNCVFHAISNVYDKADFYTIQNGIRTNHALRDFLPKPPRFGSFFKIKNLICFGEYERELYHRYGHSIGKLHPVGSLIGSYFKSELAKDNENPVFDVCVISQWRRLIMLKGHHPNVKNAIDTTNIFLSKSIEKKKISICVALRSNEKEEREYYVNLFGPEVHLVNFDQENMSTYFAMHKSKVIVTYCSTVGYEALGWGKKVLFCNFSGEERRNFIIDGFWSINKIDYEEFKRKFDYLINIDQKEYRNLTKDVAKYVMNYDPLIPVHKYIRDIVLRKLA